ncbi:MAG: hypothetical protein O3B13_21325 [Planctomycetota bacterium]|nr:hypothetical protein [Planctomycetota bacterium]
MSQLVEQMHPDVNPQVSAVSNEFDYRPVPPLAAVTAVLGIFSLGSLITEFAIPFALLGVALGVVASRQISHSRGEFSGLWLARGGLVMCVVCLFAGSALHAYLYATEVPEGYTRLSFVTDIAKKGFAVHDGRQAYHPDVKALEGQKIFLKGYMYPDGRMDGIRQFILCKDSGECCFGGKPELTDMIFIDIPEGVPSATYFDGMVAIAGKFVLGDLRRAGELRPAYKIEATHFGVARKLY